MSTEAQLVSALNDLRRIQGIVRVQELRIEGAEKLIGEVREVFTMILEGLTGDAKKEAVRIDRVCQDWQTRGK